MFIRFQELSHEEMSFGAQTLPQAASSVSAHISDFLCFPELHAAIHQRTGLNMLRSAMAI